jgi:hypothetical protein
VKSIRYGFLVVFKNIDSQSLPEENPFMERITMAHGACGTVMGDLIKNHVLKNLGASSRRPNPKILLTKTRKP